METGSIIFIMTSSTAADVRGTREPDQSASIAFLVRFFEWFGDLGFFCFQLVRGVFFRPYEAREFAHQLEELGSKSLPLVALALESSQCSTSNNQGLLLVLAD